MRHFVVEADKKSFVRADLACTGDRLLDPKVRCMRFRPEAIKHEHGGRRMQVCPCGSGHSGDVGDIREMRAEAKAETM
jgi:hypothetical protein